MVEAGGGSSKIVMISGKVRIVEYDENQSAVYAASLSQMKVLLSFLTHFAVSILKLFMKYQNRYSRPSAIHWAPMVPTFDSLT